MQANIEEHDDVLVVHLEGHLDFESADAFRIQCRQFLKDRKVVFNLRGLSFVGSSGITPFLETVIELFEANNGAMKLCGVSSEFLKVFEASNVRNLEIYEDSRGAALSFRQLIANQQASEQATENAIDTIHQFGLTETIQEVGDEGSSNSSSE